MSIVGTSSHYRIYKVAFYILRIIDLFMYRNTIDIPDFSFTFFLKFNLKKKEAGSAEPNSKKKNSKNDVVLILIL